MVTARAAELNRKQRKELARRLRLEEVVVGGGLAVRGLALSRYLIQSPEAQNEDGQNLTDAVVGVFVAEAIANSTHGY